MADHELAVERGVHREAAHPLKGDARLIARRGADRDGCALDADQVMQAD